MKNIHQLKRIFVLPNSPKEIENKAVQFTSALAHELRNPLTNIILSVDQLLTLVENNTEVRMYLDIIMRGAERINKVAGMLLKSNASDSMQREECSIHQLLEEVLEIAGDRIRLKHISIDRSYETRDLRALINVQELKMALTNIVINAVDAMSMDIGQLKIITTSIGDKFMVQIQDNGCGISEENLKNIFKPFFSNKPGGLGMGLAATWDILKSNHVGVNVKSVEGRGTSFNLLFDKSYDQSA